MIQIVGKKIYFWSDIDDMVKGLSKKIKKLDPQPLYIYGIPRGGLVPAVLLSHQTGIKYKPSKSLINSNTLVIDDICDSGETLEKIKTLYPDCLTLTLFTKTSASIQPDIYGKVTGEDWIEFPWETHTSPTKRDKTKF